MMKNYGGKVFLAFACAMVVTGCLGFEQPDTGMSNRKQTRGFYTGNQKDLMGSRQGRIPHPLNGVNGSSYENANQSSYETNTATESYVDNSDIYTSAPITIDKTPLSVAQPEFTTPVVNTPKVNTPVVTQPVATPVHRTEPVIERPTIQAVKPIKYTVVRGDSLWKIGRYYGVTMNTLANFNNIPLKSRLKIGQTIMLPPGAKYNPSPKPIKRPKKVINKIVSKPHRGTKKSYTPKGKVPIPASGKYVIQKGDSLWKIAHKFGVSVLELKRLNKMKTNNIRPNKTIILRSGVSTGTVVVEKRPNVAAIAAKKKVEKGDTNNEEKTPQVLDNDPNDDNTGEDEDDDSLAFSMYTVSDNDETLKSIAETFAVTEESIKALNPKVDWDNLRSGMEIKCPGLK